MSSGPRKPGEHDDPRRHDHDPPWKRIDESSTPLPGETDYDDDDEDADDAESHVSDSPLPGETDYGDDDDNAKI